MVTHLMGEGRLRPAEGGRAAFPSACLAAQTKRWAEGVATAEFSKFAGILSTALSQHHLSGFERAQLEFHHHFSHVRLCATPIDGSPPGSSIHGIFQARIPEWVVNY